MARLSAPNLIGLGVLALALAAGPSAVEAQISPQGGPVGYSADNQAYENGILTLTGRVEFIQGTARMRADVVRVYRQASAAGANGFAGGDIQRMEAEGNVYYVTRAAGAATDQVIRGDNAVYTVANDTIVVTGDVILQQGQSVTTGSRLTAQVKAGTARMEGAAGPGGTRVRGVIYPDGQQPARRR